MATKEPTPEQIASRNKLNDFVDAMKPILDLGRSVRSKLFGRPDAELKEWLRRGAALQEIESSDGYQLITSTVDVEIAWAQAQLEVCAEAQIVELRCYLRALRFVQGFILTVQRNADVSSKVLAGRAGEIPRTTFVKPATVRN